MATTGVFNALCHLLLVFASTLTLSHGLPTHDGYYGHPPAHPDNHPCPVLERRYVEQYECRAPSEATDDICAVLQDIMERLGCDIAPPLPDIDQLASNSPVGPVNVQINVFPQGPPSISDDTLASTSTVNSQDSAVGRDAGKAGTSVAPLPTTPVSSRAQTTPDITEVKDSTTHTADDQSTGAGSTNDNPASDGMTQRPNDFVPVFVPVDGNQSDNSSRETAAVPVFVPAHFDDQQQGTTESPASTSAQISETTTPSENAIIVDDPSSKEPTGKVETTGTTSSETTEKPRTETTQASLPEVPGGFFPEITQTEPAATSEPSRPSTATATLPPESAATTKKTEVFIPIFVPVKSDSADDSSTDNSEGVVPLFVPSSSNATTERPAVTSAPASVDETTQAPVPTTQTLVPTTQAPVPTTQAPVLTTQAPVPTTQAHVPTTQAPIPTTQAPVPTTQDPVPTTQAPDPTTQAPVPTTQAPVQTTQAPVLTTQAHVQTTQAPVPTTQAPVPTTKAPVLRTQAPVPTPIHAAQSTEKTETNDAKSTSDSNDDQKAPTTESEGLTGTGDKATNEESYETTTESIVDFIADQFNKIFEISEEAIDVLKKEENGVQGSSGGGDGASKPSVSAFEESLLKPSPPGFDDELVTTTQTPRSSSAILSQPLELTSESVLTQSASGNADSESKGKALAGGPAGGCAATCPASSGFSCVQAGDCSLKGSVMPSLTCASPGQVCCLQTCPFAETTCKAQCGDSRAERRDLLCPGNTKCCLEN